MSRCWLYRFFLAGCLAAWAGLALGAASDPNAWAQSNHLIANALGAINGHTYTNCREAFLANYARGFRIFETDLNLTSDNQIACVHDWSFTLLSSLGISVPAGQENQPLTLAAFKAQKIFGVYTTMGFQDLVQLLHDYPDVYLVTDTKITTGSGIAQKFTLMKNIARQIDPAVLDRILPEIYNQPMYDTVMGIYPFKSCLYTIYGNPDTPDQAISFMQRRGLRVFSIPVSWATPSFLQRIQGYGFYSYVWDVSAIVDNISVARALMGEGVTGFYTNFLLPYQVSPSATTRWTIDLPTE